MAPQLYHRIFRLHRRDPNDWSLWPVDWFKRVNLGETSIPSGRSIAGIADALHVAQDTLTMHPVFGRAIEPIQCQRDQ
jgi:hypothetical protein